jgi:UDP-glucose 4-epimerase
MRTLVTGGAGFIGSHLVDALLATGDEVVVLDDLSTGRRETLAHVLDAESVQLVEGSTSDGALIDELVSSADRCFHLASAVGVQLVVDRPLESLLRNIRGCDNVIGAAARHDKRLVFASTSEIYGKDSVGALSEDSDRLLGPPQTARWGYATAKVVGEMLAYGYTREQGAEMIVVRLFNTVGPRQTGAYGMVLPNFARQALLGEEVTVFGDGTQSRCFCHVADTIDGIMALAGEDRAVGRAFNVGSHFELTINELAERVIERAESTSRIVHVDFEQAYSEGFEELGRRQPDVSALSKLTGWRPLRTIEDAIDDVLAFQRELLRNESLV